MNAGRLAPIFSTFFALCYALAEPCKLYLFMYYPALGEFAVTPRPAAEAGPPILWYGWMAFAVAGGTAATLAFALLSRRLDRDVWPTASWLAPVAASLVLIFLARVWFY